MAILINQSNNNNSTSGETLLASNSLENSINEARNVSIELDQKLADLKSQTDEFKGYIERPAAFRRLCVETVLTVWVQAAVLKPAAFRRLCVETVFQLRPQRHCLPAAFRRLCVETKTQKPA